MLFTGDLFHIVWDSIYRIVDRNFFVKLFKKQIYANIKSTAMNENTVNRSLKKPTVRIDYKTVALVLISDVIYIQFLTIFS